ncbi:sulfur carrier protein ThiS adenylyltransferase ThiF [Desulfofundulus thermobenzoicus]|uniref:Sulfur carrier protein ThiS adenylyltransferase ThiF n=1 Tax=Desulfofundulus thermobenzoicus TaxID=29376 RepID=A0A6N7IT94_9FIRM|nr:sulfur carrier protein ThiS adenylyltransferase ThiF [Desulfofundulus thermobenzoicus]MQL52783.1 sulfur carrier protein ThiS adenylyltransferase ThiF [Desulfofundulus thermobenzoicus]
MNAFETTLAATLGPENLARIQQVKVGIAGAGGLGSNCAAFLVRTGFKRLKIVDFDRVEAGNLNRQFFFAGQVGLLKVEALAENLRRINPDLFIESLALRIEKDNVAGLFDDCPVVVEALDRPEYKKLVVETCLGLDKLVVAASGLAGWGRSDGIVIHRVKENFFLVGDLVSEAGPDCPPLAPGVAVAAAKQADLVLSHVLGKGLQSQTPLGVIRDSQG